MTIIGATNVVQMGATTVTGRRAAFVIIGTAGAEGIKPSLTVGNGLCAVPLRGEYNL